MVYDMENPGFRVFPGLDLHRLYGKTTTTFGLNKESLRFQQNRLGIRSMI